MTTTYVINPVTGRKIKVNGPTYQKLKDQGRLDTIFPKASDGRGSRLRGWAVDSPKRGEDRHRLKHQCGNQCFLIPDREAFPICPRCAGDRCSCQVDCRGLMAAKVRAHQYHYTDLYKTIDQLERDKCPKTKDVQYN